MCKLLNQYQEWLMASQNYWLIKIIKTQVARLQRIYELQIQGLV